MHTNLVNVIVQARCEMELTSKNVNDVFLRCLYDNKEEDVENAIIVDGVIGKFGFNPINLIENTVNISKMLDCLPDNFKETSGGGWSFLNACIDKDGVQWTGEHRTVEKIVCLGIATGKAKYLLPKDMWNALPGGMPYFVVL